MGRWVFIEVVTVEYRGLTYNRRFRLGVRGQFSTCLIFIKSRDFSISSIAFDFPDFKGEWGQIIYGMDL